MREQHENVLLELEWKPVTATQWINDVEDSWTFDLSKTFDLVRIVSDIERESMRYLWRAASLYWHGESLAATAPDLTVLRRHPISLRMRDLLERAGMLQQAACGGLWSEQRRHEVFLQDHANCPRCDNAGIETEEHRFYCFKGNTTGDPDLVDLVAKDDWIVPEARVGLTKPELRSFLRGLTPGSWLVEEPFEGREVFLVADAIHDGFHVGPGTYFPDGSKLYPDPRRREVGWGFCSITADLQLRTGACGPATLDKATVPTAELLAVIFLVEKSVGNIHIHSDCKCVCSGTDKITQRTERGAHVTPWTRLQQASSRHQGDVEKSWCKAHITSDNFH